MKRIFNSHLILNPFSLIKYQYHINKFNKNQHNPHQNGPSKHNLFNQKTFSDIINILKNPDNPYPKNSAYYHAILEYILDQSINNQKVMLQYGDAIHFFLQDIMERIKIMGPKELSDMLTLLRFRPKALRFEKQLLLSIHSRFQTRIKQLIQLNQSKQCNSEQVLTIEQIKCQIEGLFYLKRNTSILFDVLNFAYNLIHAEQNKSETQKLKNNLQIFQQILFIINENLDDTIDPIRESIVEFIHFHYTNNTLIFNRQILRMISKCKFYKNFPLVRNQYWIHQYIYNYLQYLIKNQKNIDIEEFVSALKSCISYVMHVDPWSKNQFVTLIEKGYKIAKNNLLNISYINDKEQLLRQVNSISLQIKLIPSYLFIKNQLKVNTVIHTEGNKVDSQYIKQVIEELKPIIKKFILCYFEKTQQLIDGQVSIKLTQSIQENINILNDLIKDHNDPEKLLLKSVENLLNAVTVFKDYNIIEVDTDFVLLLIETEVIYCVLCRHWIKDQVRFLRLLEHSVFVIGQLQKQILNNPEKFKKYQQKLLIIKNKMEEELAIYDNVQKSYKQFTVLRLVSILKSMNIKPKYLGDFYRNVRLKKPNIYVQTLSRTMLRVHNYEQVIDAFEMMFQGKIPVKQIQLGRIVFLSSKQPTLLKYWLHTNREQFINKICFCRRIITNIVSIIRMDNLQINRNSIQILSEIVTENKIYELQNYSVSNHQQQSHQLKRIMCNNFSILFRYSKMDSMIDDIFIVHKNIPTLFRNKFSHIQTMKILSFAAYLSEEQSIFYINRQNKNALFKFVIMLMQKVPYSQRNKQHYLLKSGFHSQTLILNVVAKIIEQYWPDNKLTNKAMPFYAEFLVFYTKINQFSRLIKNQNTTFLIIKQIIQDYKQMLNKQQFKHIISRIQNNYEILHFLSIFDNQTNINNTLENVMNSMNFVVDLRIFQDFMKHIQKQIIQEIDNQNKKLENNNKTQLIKGKFQNLWLNKHLINRLIIQKFDSVDELNQYQDYQILSLMTVEIFAYGIRQRVNENMQVILKRLLKIDPSNMKFNNQSLEALAQKGITSQYPYELFKIALSNFNIYMKNRQNRLQTGKQLISDQISNQKITEWLIKSQIDYFKIISNNQQLLDLMHFLNNLNIDILSLIQNNQLDIKQNMNNLALAYYDVEILSIFFSQNLIKFNDNLKQNQTTSTNMTEFKNDNIIKYIRTILKQFDQTYLINNYGIYFQEEGEKILNIMRSLIITIMQHQPTGSKNHKQANQVMKILKQFVEQYNKIANKTHKYNKMNSGGKFSYLYNKQQGNLVDVHNKSNLKKSRNPYNQENPEISSMNIKMFSDFSQILQIITRIRLNKWSATNFNQEHQDFINRINTQINKSQKTLFNRSQLTYFINNQTKKSDNDNYASQRLISQMQFKQFNLKLYTKQSGKKLTIFYLVNPNTSMLYDFCSKKRQRLTGEQQLIIDYLQCLIKTSQQVQGDSEDSLEIRFLPNNLSKIEFKKILSTV